MTVLTIPGKDPSTVCGSYSCLSILCVYIYIYSLVGEINLGGCQHDIYQPWLTCMDFNLIYFPS